MIYMQKLRYALNKEKKALFDCVNWKVCIYKTKYKLFLNMIYIYIHFLI